MADANESVDVYCHVVEKVENSLMFTLEIDDLPDVDEAEKMVKARLMAGGKKVTALDVIGVMSYIYVQNRLMKGRKK